MIVARRMSHPVHTARRETRVADVVRVMTEHRVSAIPVVDDAQHVVGMIMVSDLVPHTRNAPASNVRLLSLCDEYVDFASLSEAYTKVGELPVGDVMREGVIRVAPETEIGIAAQLMAEQKVHALPVVRADGVLVGIVTRTDLARMAIEKET